MRSHGQVLGLYRGPIAQLRTFGKAGHLALHTAGLRPGTEEVCGVILPRRFSINSSWCLSRPERLLLTPCLKAARSAWVRLLPGLGLPQTRSLHCHPGHPSPVSGLPFYNPRQKEVRTPPGILRPILASTSHQEHHVLWAPPTSLRGQQPPRPSPLITVTVSTRFCWPSGATWPVSAETPAIHITLGAQFCNGTPPPPSRPRLQRVAAR